MSIARPASAIARFGVRMFFFAALVFTLPSTTASAAPKAELWERWTAHNAASTAAIDHSAWETFLKANLVRGRDSINRLAYGRVTAADRSALARYLDALAAVPISRYTRDEQLAIVFHLDRSNDDVGLRHIPDSEDRQSNEQYPSEYLKSEFFFHCSLSFANSCLPSTTLR